MLNNYIHISKQVNELTSGQARPLVNLSTSSPFSTFNFQLSIEEQFSETLTPVERERERENLIII